MRLNQYSDPTSYDSSPIPRPTKNAPYIVTPDEVTDKMIEMADISKEDLVYDLGCGDGRLVITAAVKHGCRGVGFGLDPLRVEEATKNAELRHVDQLVKIKQQNVFTVDLREADAVLMYLLPQMLRDLVPQFDQCRPGTRIVSHDFKIEGVQEDKTEDVKLGTERHFVHLYVTPLKKLPPPPPRKRRSN
jgi:ribosomal protein L11 methylase PrmA